MFNGITVAEGARDPAEKAFHVGGGIVQPRQTRGRTSTTAHPIRKTRRFLGALAKPGALRVCLFRHDGCHGDTPTSSSRSPAKTRRVKNSKQPLPLNQQALGGVRGRRERDVLTRFLPFCRDSPQARTRRLQEKSISTNATHRAPLSKRTQLQRRL